VLTHVLSATCPQFAPLQIDPKSPPDFPAPEECVLIFLSLCISFSCAVSDFRSLPAPVRLVSSLAVEAGSFSVDHGAAALFWPSQLISVLLLYLTWVPVAQVLSVHSRGVVHTLLP
jgi:hypothetical protein